MSARTTIGALFQTAVTCHGHREALVYRDLRWTYRDVGERVAEGAIVLGALTSTERTRVAIVGANHPAYVVAYFAAHVLGAGTIEIGRDESLENIRWATSRAGAGVILTDRPDLLDVQECMPVMSFAAFLEACEAQRSGERTDLAAAPPDDPGEACVVYTSGTTGTPKGVVLSHSNILFVVNAVCEYLALTSADRYALALPLAHTYGKSNLLSAVAVGAAVVLVENPHDPEAFFGRIMRERCTVLSVVPFHLNVLARRGIPDHIDLGTLRAITSSGGPLPDDTVRAVTNLLPSTQLYSMYGLTESSTRVTFLPPEWLHAKRGSVGRPLTGVCIEIRDDNHRALPAGVVGHVFVRGPNVMQGYLGDAAATAETIVNDWLRTGDLGYLDADDCLFLSGREKEIIKVAGERISPIEIEEVIAAHPAIAEAAVVGVPDPLLGETVWAYVILHSSATGTADVAAFCAARLSPHKVPRRFVEIAHIPRTPTGKVRRHLLKELSP